MKNNIVIDYDERENKKNPPPRNPKNAFWVGVVMALFVFIISVYNTTLSEYFNYYVWDVSYYIGAILQLILLWSIFIPQTNTKIPLIPVAVWGSLGLSSTLYLMELIISRGFSYANFFGYYPIDFLITTILSFLKGWAYLIPIVVVGWWQRKQLTKSWLTDLPSNGGNWLETLLPTIFLATFFAAKFDLFGDPTLALPVLYFVVTYIHLRNYYKTHSDWEFDAEDSLKISLLLGVCFLLLTTFVFGIMKLEMYVEVISEIAFSGCVLNVFLHYFFPKIYTK